jgi:hypothetical protein
MMASSNPPKHFDQKDVQSWVNDLQDHVFYNSVSLEVAKRFHDGSLSFRICDQIMNNLWSIVVSNLDNSIIPTPFFEIYEAFDAGEYHRLAEKGDDPVTEFTKPLIAEILAE